MPVGPVGQAGLDIAQGIVGTGIGMALGKYNDKRQLKQQRKLQELEIAGTKELTDYSYGKQLQMWKDTNYSAQMEQLKMAGLNPGLLYGMGGGGGQSTGGGAEGVTGGHAPVGGQEVGMGIELAMMSAQKRLIEAQAKKTETEAANIGEGGIDTAVKAASIEKMIQETKNEAEKTLLTKIQAGIAAIDQEIAGKTIEEQINIVVQTAGKLDQEVMQEEERTFRDRATRYTVVDSLKADLATKLLDQEAIRAGIKLTNTEREAISTKLAQEWRNLEIAAQNADTQQGRLEWDKKMKDVKESTKLKVETVGKVLSGVVRGLKGK